MERMFTGLVEELGTVESAASSGGRHGPAALHLVVKAPAIAKEARLGDSIAINGCCLTVVKKTKQSLAFDAGSETLSRTNLDRLEVGSRVNLERSLAVGDRLGGHFVTGHIDGLATVIRRRDEGPWAHITLRAQARLLAQMASKGSVALDGVSLTLVTVDDDRFSVALIPYTLEHTTLGALDVGSVVNVETDVLAKYVERQLKAQKDVEVPIFGSPRAP
jgi:riboflavin synthase